MLVPYWYTYNKQHVFIVLCNVIVVVVFLGEKAGQFGLSPEKCGAAAEFCQRCSSQVFTVHYMGWHKNSNYAVTVFH